MKKIFFGLLLVFVLSFFSLFLGVVKVDLKSVFEFFKLITLSVFKNKPLFEIIKSNENKDLIIIFLRVSRVFGGILIGISLSIAGFLLQTIFRNQLVDGYILGVLGGSQLGVNVSLLLGLSISNIFLGLNVPAFLGSLFVIIILYFFSLKYKENLTLLLVGLSLSYFFYALNSLIILLKPDILNQYFYISLMGLSRISLENLLLPFIFIFLMFLMVILIVPHLKTYLLGEETSRSLGVNVNRIKILSILIASLLSAVSLSIGGIISFVGIFSTHFASFFYKSFSRGFLLMTAIIGISTILVADLISRSLFISEVPINIIISALGAPYFIFLVLKRKSKSI